ncbi:unnamed protein product [Lactuca virosa]|uniref:O-fucosyltransferase family protein n=1 Tax=Lactuca virosa TaxID=75947 RepID=A0AAU9PEH5_9ASTR|nr:unnamed protein product [Lactuca virosa]
MIQSILKADFRKRNILVHEAATVKAWLPDNDVMPISPGNYSNHHIPQIIYLEKPPNSQRPTDWRDSSQQSTTSLQPLMAISRVLVLHFPIRNSCYKSFNIRCDISPAFDVLYVYNLHDQFGDKSGKNVVQMYGHLASMASSALVERELKQEESRFWKESYRKASLWSPCADRKESRNTGSFQSNTGYILVSANGGLNQQRVAVCNTVAVASLLNATLVIPRFLYSNVWKDPSQFGDIYQEDYFMKTLKDEVNIVKDLPPHLKSLNFKEIGSLITDADLTKEATSVEYIKKILPILSKNGVVHFLGYGNRLGFDPLPSDLQRLRRIRKYDEPRNKLDKELLGDFITNPRSKSKSKSKSNSQDTDGEPLKYLALHLRFEVDMVAYSLCDFGGGKIEKDELQTYRESHFPLLMQRLKKSKPISPEELRISGRCPLTPEEAALVLAALDYAL